MILGFHYHITVYQDKSGQISLPDYMGLFVDELAKHAERLYYFAYISKKPTVDQNYVLKQNNIHLVNLGEKKLYPIPVILGHLILGKYKKMAKCCDAILVRAPSPLAPYFYTRFKRITKIRYLMVGDYMEGIKHMNFNFVKQSLINFFTYINEYFQNKAIRSSVCMVNSVQLKIKYEKLNPTVEVVKTTTLTKEVFFDRPDTCNDPANIKLLFVGRIEKAKGMDELVAAFLLLRKNKIPATLHLAGWNTADARNYFQALNENTFTANNWQYHGLLSGPDLFDLYRACDVFILPSHHEGFPRVIWEAMASSLPVVTTKVGSIPHYLNDRENAILVDVGDKKALYESIIELIGNNNLRIQLINNAFNLVKENTIDMHINKLIDVIKK